MQLLVTRISKLITRVVHNPAAFLLILTSWAVAQAPSAAVEVRDLQVSRNGSETNIKVTLSASVNPSVEVATHPDRLVLVLPNTLSSAQQQRVSVNDNGIRRVRIGLNSNNPPVTRVVVDLDEARRYALTPDGNKVTLTVRSGHMGPSDSESSLVRAGPAVSAQLRHPASPEHELSSNPASDAPATPTPPSTIASGQAEGARGIPSVSNSAEHGEAASEASPAASNGETKAEAPTQLAAAVSSAGPSESVRDPTPPPAAVATTSEGSLKGPSPIPVVTGFMAFQSSFSPGEKHINPVFDPILLLPLGNKLFVESEFEMNLDVVRSEGQWGPAAVDHGIEYLQLNYMAHPNLTITAGRFLTPFGIYRERIHPLWIRNLQDEPIIFAMNANSSNGAMLRGAARLNSGVNLTYATYYSAPANWKLMPSDRRAGGRGSLFFPNKRIEIGASFSRTLGDLRYNMVGGDVTWNLKRIPLDIRAEGLHNPALGSGYWVEGAYRLNKLGGNAFLRKSQVVLRGEQYFTPSTMPMSDAAADAMSELPDRDTKRIGLGWNYYLTNGIRLNASFGRNFALGENRNTWGAGITYRFATF
jgi:AMIN domain